jgi:hypothetical protein
LLSVFLSAFLCSLLSSFLTFLVSFILLLSFFLSSFLPLALFKMKHNTDMSQTLPFSPHIFQSFVLFSPCFFLVFAKEGRVGTG